MISREVVNGMVRRSPLHAVLDVGCVTIFASSVFITPRKTSLGTRTSAARESARMIVSWQTLYKFVVTTTAVPSESAGSRRAIMRIG